MLEIQRNGEIEMGRLLLSEWERVWHRKITVYLLLAYICLMFIITIFLKTFGEQTIFYTRWEKETLNSLNFMWFCLKETSIVLTMAIFPILFLESLIGEYASGAYRMVLTRPYERWKFLLSKWVIQALLVALFLLITFIFSIIAGKIFFPEAHAVTLYQDPSLHSELEAYLYAFKFYGVYLIIQLAALALCSMIAAIIHSVVFSFLFLIGLYFGLAYLSSGKIMFFVIPHQTIFNILSANSSILEVLSMIIIFLIGYVFSFLHWTKRDIKV